MRFRLRTLLIVLALGPPVLGWLVWPEVEARWRAWHVQKGRVHFPPAGPGLKAVLYGERPAPAGGGLIELPVDE